MSPADPDEDELAEFHHIGAVGDLQRGLRVLLDQQHRDAGGAQFADGAEDVGDDDRAPARGSARRASAISARPSARGPSPASAARRRRACRPVACAAPSAAETARRPARTIAPRWPSESGTRRAADCPRHSWCRTVRDARAPGSGLRRRGPRYRAAPCRCRRRRPSPFSGSMPMMALSSVVLPAPLAPMMVTISLPATSSDTERTASTLP